MRTKIFTDTTCDLSPERRAAHDITALPLHVFLGETDYLDGVDVTPQQLFDYALQNKQLPKTAAVGEYDFENAFREALDNGYDELVYTGLSSKLSSTYQNACLARDSLIEKGYDAKRPAHAVCRPLTVSPKEGWRDMRIMRRGLHLMSVGSKSGRYEHPRNSSMKYYSNVKRRLSSA